MHGRMFSSTLLSNTKRKIPQDVRIIVILFEGSWRRGHFTWLFFFLAVRTERERTRTATFFGFSFAFYWFIFRLVFSCRHRLPNCDRLLRCRLPSWRSHELWGRWWFTAFIADRWRRRRRCILVGIEKDILLYLARYLIELINLLDLLDIFALSRLALLLQPDIRWRWFARKGAYVTIRPTIRVVLLVIAVTHDCSSRGGESLNRADTHCTL